MGFIALLSLTLATGTAPDVELPPVRPSDLSWMPPAAVAHDAYWHSTDMAQSIRWRVWAQNSEAVAAEADRRCRIWDALDNAWIASSELGRPPSPVESDPGWRSRWLVDQLSSLRKLIGPEAYYAGRLPAPWPSELFEVVGN